MIGIHGAGIVSIGRNLPTAEINSLETHLRHLHGLITGHGAERADKIVLDGPFPKLLGPGAGKRMLYMHAASQTHHIGSAVTTLN